MIDHIGLAVTDIARSRAFYEQALAPLGMHVLATIPRDQTETGGEVVMFGAAEGVTFVIADNERPGEGTHVAFRAGTRDQVEAFHEAALAAGGTDHGAPGLREHYGPTYYAALSSIPTASTSRRSAMRRSDPALVGRGKVHT